MVETHCELPSSRLVRQTDNCQAKQTGCLFDFAVQASQLATTIAWLQSIASCLHPVRQATCITTCIFRSQESLLCLAPIQMSSYLQLCKYIYSIYYIHIYIYIYIYMYILWYYYSNLTITVILLNMYCWFIMILLLSSLLYHKTVTALHLAQLLGVWPVVLQLCSFQNLPWDVKAKAQDNLLHGLAYDKVHPICPFWNIAVV